MSHTGNHRLRAARIAAGYPSQQALADALGVGVRQVRRWESDAPPWPQGDVQQALPRLLGSNLTELGFTPPGSAPQPRPTPRLTTPPTTAAVPTQATRHRQPASAAEDYLAVVRAHRRLYWSVAPTILHPAAVAHAALGHALLTETAGRTRALVAAGLGESHLLAGRIEFFDLHEADRAAATWLRALQAAGEADDALLGAAVLAHTAFVPGWAGDREAAMERMVAARTYARRGPASAQLLAWLDAVEAECETRCGHVRTALNLIRHGEDLLARGGEHETPEWMDWFSAGRLAAFKGNTQLRAGHLPQARDTLLAALDALETGEEKQRSVLLGDLAATEAARGRPEAACQYAVRALDQLELTWYAVGMDRVREVRRALTPHQQEQCVRDLDDRLYGWSTTVSALSR
ncbi:helix-turn-helix domain-containing protein [Streptomyces albidoflavus]|uniref:helix-turn-helix domain-containing protein n=1 Tax=Streptomyces TaxID=1883 RepID=UPI001010EF82|nr:MULTISPECIES: helix-turn-helix transcriptional regulator [Streptomyces]MCU7706368.1 helix-turn-helix domain-containing protein [Streptomyces albidoflavus]RZD81586.1 transcriptional regulator [Streptomyces albidoflavus]RZD87627.1 transcriptional regulator [Streptomyces albidoflavus]RZD99110.1 transcriptional regulator [Streptomyces albidoflavus]